ncbi:MAG: DNA mismatch repair protein MutS [Vicinamibacterales bacterium]
MTQSDPRAEYTRRIALWDAMLERGERRHLLISNVRLVIAGAGAIAAWVVFVRAVAPAIVFAVPLVAFLVLIAVHALVLQKNERAARARRLYIRGVERIDGNWPGTGPDGARFGVAHPYAADLDIFGSGSLFQLLSSARTESGEETLAEWLRGPASVDEIRARQEAVAELRPKLDFREDLAVLAAEAHVGRTSGLAAWAATPPHGLASWLGGLFALLAAGTAALITLAFLDRVPGQAVLLWLLLQAGTVALWRTRIHEVVHRVDAPSLDIRLLTQLLERLEREAFVAPRLVQIHERLMAGGALPSVRLRQLQRRVSALDSMHNPLFAPFGTALLVRAQSAVWIDRWHAANGRLLLQWLGAVGELEALSSLAAFAYERPANPFPTILQEGPRFDARGLAHPLIVGHVAVANDVTLGGEAPQVLLVSGSNMSGKSTLLRAVGCNVVLALAGAPVRADALTVSPVAIGATLRVEDSLQAGISRFYAEILRIRAIVETTRGPLPLLFLLDEILHGTNSHDRRIGAEAIVRSLVKAGSIGLVTTHDLALTELPRTLERAANVHFEDRIENGRMVFDYRMRPGVVEHSNALELMRAVGLEV